MFAQQMLENVKDAAPQTIEDREIIRTRKAGYMVLLDRHDSYDMFLYMQLRKKGLPQIALTYGIGPVMDRITSDFKQSLLDHLSTQFGVGDEARPTLQ